MDFTIWLLFSKTQASKWKCQHLLCQGFKRDLTYRMIRNDHHAHTSIPGIISTHENCHVTIIKSSPWPQVLTLMGKEGEKTMVDLILDCGIFLPVEDAYGTFHQLSGKAKHRNYGHQLMREQGILWATFQRYPIPPLSLQMSKVLNLKPKLVQHSSRIQKYFALLPT